MKRKLESVPEFRSPKDWEHSLVDCHLIQEFRTHTKQKIDWYFIIGLLLSVMVYLDIVLNRVVHFDRTIILLLLILFFFYLSYASKKSLIKWRQVVKRMDSKYYQVARVWAFHIHAVCVFNGNGGTVSYGEANVRFTNGRTLKKKYTIPYEYALEIEKQDIHEDQKALLVHIPIFEKYQLVPIETYKIKQR